LRIPHGGEIHTATVWYLQGMTCHVRHCKQIIVSHKRLQRVTFTV
jgi:hypothetical protein